jgi:salicylate hydroxylase
MIRWGVDFSKIRRDESSGNRFLRWDNAAKIRDIPFSDVEQLYGFPYYFIHRADLHAALIETAERLGITIKKNSRVVKFDYEGPRVQTEDGTWYSGDLVIAADGEL